ncbi:Protein AMBP [Apodemus speciosus]|uniref:Protein AMBP n=1 Tax=Apodemus speciosus TaxID=105296 RepID=A0ABQ0EP69_APOSI
MAKACEEHSGVYQKTDTDGKFLYHTSKWNTTLESYVVHTNYDEYAIFLTKKFSHRHGPAIMAKLYRPEPQLRTDNFCRNSGRALSVGIPLRAAIIFMEDKRECVPERDGDRQVEPTSSVVAQLAHQRNLSCPGTDSVVQAGLKLRNPPASASQVLGLKRARRAVLPQENEGSGTGPLITGTLKKEVTPASSTTRPLPRDARERYYCGRFHGL